MWWADGVAKPRQAIQDRWRVGRSDAVEHLIQPTQMAIPLQKELSSLNLISSTVGRCNVACLEAWVD
jgi:hypothetical protein